MASSTVSEGSHYYDIKEVQLLEPRQITSFETWWSSTSKASWAVVSGAVAPPLTISTGGGRAVIHDVDIPLTFYNLVAVVLKRGRFSLQQGTDEAFAFPGIATYQVIPSKSSFAFDHDDATKSSFLQVTVELECPKGLTDQGVQLAGLRLPVQSLKAHLNTRDDTTIITAELQGQWSPTISFKLSPGRSPIDMYLDYIEYKPVDPAPPLSIYTLSVLMVGLPRSSNFFSVLPAGVCGFIQLPQWGVDPVHSTISTLPLASALGPVPQVNRARIIALAPSDLASPMEFFCLKLKASSVILTVDQVKDSVEEYELGLELVADLDTVKVKGRLSQTPRGPFWLDCQLSIKTSLANFWTLVGISGPIPDVISPLDPNTSVTSSDSFRFGFRLTQPYTGVHAPFRLERIIVGLDLKDMKQWRAVLPPSLQPQDGTEFTIELHVLSPTTPNPAARVGAMLRYTIRIDDEASRMENQTARLHFECSHMPVVTSLTGPGKYVYRTSVSAYVDRDDDNILPPPDLKAVLKRLAGTSLQWDDVTASMPVLANALEKITIRNIFLEIETPSCAISYFAINASVQNIEILSQPSIILGRGSADVRYDGVEWNSLFETDILLANEFILRTSLQLPSSKAPGLFKFTNDRDALTFAKFVHLVDPSLDLVDVPIVGPLLADVALSKFVMQVDYHEDKHLHVSAFEVEITWASASIAQLRLTGNRLAIAWRGERNPGGEGMHTAGSQEQGSTVPSKIPGYSGWSIHWEGYISTTLFLALDVQTRSRLSRQTGERTRTVTARGQIVNFDGLADGRQLVDSFTRGSEEQKTSLWEDTFPRENKSTFLLQGCQVEMIFATDDRYSISAECSYGSASGEALLILQRSTSSGWAFFLRLAARNFKISEFFKNEDLGNTVEKHLVLSQVELVAFSNWSPETLDPPSPQLEAGKSEKAPLGMPDMLNKRTGVILGATLTIKDAVGNTDSLIKQLSVLTEPQFLETVVQLSCTIFKETSLPTATALTAPTSSDLAKPAGSKFEATFIAALDTFVTFDFIAFTGIRLSFAFTSVESVDGKIQTHKSLTLTGYCEVCFSNTQTSSSWKSTAILSVDDTKASFTLEAFQGEQKLSELGIIAFTDVKLKITYAFSRGRTGVQHDPTLPSVGQVAQGELRADYQIDLQCGVRIGDTHARAIMLFNRAKPSVLLVYVDQTINLGKLVQGVLGDIFPAEFLDISFADLRLWYSWDAAIIQYYVKMGNASAETLTLFKFEPGFRAAALTNIFGIKFNVKLAIELAASGAGQRGISIVGTLTSPLDLAIVVLHDQEEVTRGPSLAYSTYDNPKEDIRRGLLIKAGLTILGYPIANVKLHYQSAHGTDGRPCLLTDISVQSPVFPGGEVSFSLRIVEVEGNPQIRFNDLPFADIPDLFSTKELLDTIFNLTAKDLCGAIKLVERDAVKTVFKIWLETSDVQPDEVAMVSFKIKGKWQMTVAGATIADIIFEPLDLKVIIPKDWNSLLSLIVKRLRDSVESIVECLKRNTTQFNQVLILLGVERLGLEALKAWACRNKPLELLEPAPLDPFANFKPPILPFVPPDPLAPFAVLPIVVGVVTVLLTLFWWIISKTNRDDPSTPAPPKPKPLPDTPDELSAYERAIHALLNKEFDRWRKSDSMESALTVAHLCYNEYREAIEILQWALQPKSGITETLRMEYSAWLAHLVYEFSRMGDEFGRVWLRVPAQTALEADSNQFTLSWAEKLQGRCMAVEIQEHARLVLSGDYALTYTNMRWRRPLSEPVHTMNIQATVVLFVSIQDASKLEPVFIARGPSTAIAATGIGQSSLYGDTALIASIPYFDDFDLSQRLTSHISAKAIQRISIRWREVVEGLVVDYKISESREGKKIQHGTVDDNIDPAELKRGEVVLEDTESLVRVEGLAGPHPAFNYWPYIYQLTFHILNSANSEIRTAGPFGGPDENQEATPFSFAGPISGFAGRAITGTERRGLRALAFKYIKPPGEVVEVEEHGGEPGAA